VYQSMAMAMAMAMANEIVKKNVTENNTIP
jgi:hypothetical protein